jgi:hypothetical protein
VYGEDLSLRPHLVKPVKAAPFRTGSRTGAPAHCELQAVDHSTDGTNDELWFAIAIIPWEECYYSSGDRGFVYCAGTWFSYGERLHRSFAARRVGASPQILKKIFRRYIQNKMSQKIVITAKP